MLSHGVGKQQGIFNANRCVVRGVEQKRWRRRSRHTILHRQLCRQTCRRVFADQVARRAQVGVRALQRENWVRQDSKINIIRRCGQRDAREMAPCREAPDSEFRERFLAPNVRERGSSLMHGRRVNRVRELLDRLLELREVNGPRCALRGFYQPLQPWRRCRSARRRGILQDPGVEAQLIHELCRYLALPVDRQEGVAAAWAD